LLEPLGREVLLSVTCGPHPLKVLVPAPCHLAPETPVWLNLSHGPHHFFDPIRVASCSVERVWPSRPLLWGFLRF
jgi:hypothetical protein